MYNRRPFIEDQLSSGPVPNGVVRYAGAHDASRNVGMPFHRHVVSRASHGIECMFGAV